MYLIAKRPMNPSSEEDRENLEERLKEARMWDGEAEVSKDEVVKEVAYWRKANAVHKWFVENVQDGEDQNGEETPVTRSQLRDLLSICQTVINDKTLAKKLLPTQCGFFFGSTNYDDCYFKKIQYTVDFLEEIEEDEELHENWTLYYRSSW